MRNHGTSFRSPDHSYRALALDLARVIESVGGAADLLGHSMGGKAAMVLALTRPEILNRLVVLDIAPVTYLHSHLPLVQAMQSIPLSKVKFRAEADRMLAERISDAATRAFLLQSLDLAPEQPVWLLNLPALSANLGAIAGFPILDGNYPKPSLFLAGSRSDYIDQSGVRAIHRLFSDARIETIEDAGHWLHAERPDAVADSVRRFLDR